MFRVSERLIGVTDEGFVEPSGGLEKLNPLIFQSDCNRSANVLNFMDLSLPLHSQIRLQGSSFHERDLHYHARILKLC
jgi:hypothetical protein